ncbi:MAG: hypothetical protein IID44_26625 [Planctomycetes bacterium]|nr:hypothetical protein [Planctomycetota bacterium]
MEWTSNELVQVLSYLLPGFLAAWVFHGLTAHPKSSPFERIVQALIFTVIVHALTTVARWSLILVGVVRGMGSWTPDVNLVCSIIFALCIGVGFAIIANHNILHERLGRLGITRRTSFPHEWFSAFSRHGMRYIVLHLKNGRRLQGWPEEWPDHADSGHFVIAEPKWLLKDNSEAPLHSVERLLLPASDVEFIEFQKFEHELNVSRDEVREVEFKLIELQRPSDGETPPEDV